jgi:pimeloyl-ACP methyl ester carboxylesterase
MRTATPRDDFAQLPGRGVRLHYRDWGGDGPPLVLLHGLSSSCRIWDWTAPLLTERFRVLALDQRSHGLSDQPADGYGFADVAADLAAFLEAVEVEKAALVGHSWGAGVALYFAAENPERVRGVGLVDGGVVDIAELGTWDVGGGGDADAAPGDRRHARGDVRRLHAALAAGPRSLE